MSQSIPFISFIERLFTKRWIRFEFLIVLYTKCIAQWVSLLPFSTPLRAGLISVGICSFVIFISLLVSQMGHQVAEPAKPDWQANASGRSSDIKDKRRYYALTEVPLPKFFEEYGGDEYGGFIE